MDQPQDTRDRSEDFVAQLLVLLSQHIGGFEEQLATVIEEQIRDQFGGERVYVHRAGWFDQPQRDAQIRMEREQGRSLGWLASRYAISRSQVRRICGELE